MWTKSYRNILLRKVSNCIELFMLLTFKNYAVYNRSAIFFSIEQRIEQWICFNVCQQNGQLRLFVNLLLNSQIITPTQTDLEWVKLTKSTKKKADENFTEVITFQILYEYNYFLLVIEKYHFYHLKYKILFRNNFWSFCSSFWRLRMY